MGKVKSSIKEKDLFIDYEEIDRKIVSPMMSF
jgi:hypothetical protein